MNPRKTLFFICLIASTFSLSIGYGLAGRWGWSLISVLMIPAWLFARKHSGSWLPVICLLVSVCLAVIGKQDGASPLLMIFGSGIALAVWDLLLLDAALGKHPANEQSRQYETRHLQALMLSLGLGLAVASVGRLLSLRVPFWGLVLMIAFALFGLDRVWVYLKKPG
jgi:hypothetical protein